jgi:hypothetical protein
VSGSEDGFNMDIQRDMVVSVAKDGDEEKTRATVFYKGAYGSAMEAELPVRMLSTSDVPWVGVATIQAHKLANDQGIPIYRINQTNASTTIPLLQIDQNTLTTVQDAVSAGMEVTVSRTSVNFNRRNVLGIIVSDPSTGSASYLISGINGSFVDTPENLELASRLGIFIFFGLILAAGAIATVPVVFPIFALLVAVTFAISLIAFEILVATQGIESRIFNLTECELAIVTLTTVASLVLLQIVVAVLEAVVTGIILDAVVAKVATANIVSYVRAIAGLLGAVGRFLCD